VGFHGRPALWFFSEREMTRYRYGCHFLLLFFFSELLELIDLNFAFGKDHGDLPIVLPWLGQSLAAC